MILNNMGLEDPCRKNYQRLIECMQETVQELGVGCPKIRFQSGSLENHLHDVVENNYFPSLDSYEEVSIGRGDVRLRVRGDGSVHIQLNIGRIRDNQHFYETLWKYVQKKGLPLTMSDRDPQDPHPELCQEFGFYK